MVIIDSSVEVRVSHFYMVNRPFLQALLKYHVRYNTETRVSILQVYGKQNRTVCDRLSSYCELSICMNDLVFNRNETKSYLDVELINSLKTANTIFSSSSATNKLMLIISVGYLNEYEVPAMLNKTALLNKAGVEIFTYFGGYRDDERVSYRKLATSDLFASDDDTWIKTLYSTTPVNQQTCSS